MAVAATAMIVAPANWMKGIALSTATAITDQYGVWSRGLTFASGFESGNWLSRAMPKASRTVDVMIAMQHTKIAAETTSRYTVANALEKFAWMMVCGPAMVGMNFEVLGIAMSVPHRKIAPMTNAPMMEAMTALGASRLGSLVSSERVEAVSNP